VSFKHALVVLTSNIGSRAVAKTGSGRLGAFMGRGWVHMLVLGCELLAVLAARGAQLAETTARVLLRHGQGCCANGAREAVACAGHHTHTHAWLWHVPGTGGPRRPATGTIHMRRLMEKRRPAVLDSHAQDCPATGTVHTRRPAERRRTAVLDSLTHDCPAMGTAFAGQQTGGRWPCSHAQPCLGSSCHGHHAHTQVEGGGGGRPCSHA